MRFQFLISLYKITLFSRLNKIIISKIVSFEHLEPIAMIFLFQRCFNCSQLDYGMHFMPLTITKLLKCYNIY